jgi:protein phosphatase
VYGRRGADSGRVAGLAERRARFLDGRPDGRSADITVRALLPGDRYLLCSDGLSSFVPHDVLSAALNDGSADAAADQLVAAALERGGPDNITVVVADCGPETRGN